MDGFNNSFKDWLQEIIQKELVLEILQFFKWWAFSENYEDDQTEMQQ